MSTWVAAATAVGAVLATYFFCIRPASRGLCAMSPARDDAGVHVEPWIVELWDDVRVLREQDPDSDGGALR